MFRRAMTRMIFTGGSDAGNDRLGRELEPGREVDPWFVAERLARGADVPPRVPDVARARRLETLLHGLAEDDADRLRDMVDARRRAGGDVEDAAAHPFGVRGPDRRVDDVGDVGEVTGLFSISVDRDRLALVDRRDEQRNRRRVLRVRALARPEDVEVAQDNRLEGAVDAAEADAVPR